MPDIFVPEDTTGITSYYVQVANKGLLQKYSYTVADRYRDLARNISNADQLVRLLPREQTLLQNFVSYAAANGVPARWYYINQSRELILNQLQALIARDLIGEEAFYRIYNRKDATLKKAVDLLKDPSVKKPTGSGTR